jgi:hypothetical protein
MKVGVSRAAYHESIADPMIRRERLRHAQHKGCVLLLYGPDVVPQYEVWAWAKQIRSAAA